QLVADLRRPVRQRLGSAWRRELLSDEGARHPRQHRVDVREPLAGRLYRLSLPGRGEGAGLPRQLRDELLRHDGMVHKHPAAAARVICAIGAFAIWTLTAGARPQTGADAADQFYDSHFHLTNYIQQG